MKLSVPLIRQSKGTVDCAIAGVAMLFKFYGISKTFKDIKKEIEVDEVGTYAPQIGSYLIHHGFKVELVTMHPKLFTLKDKCCSQSRVKIILTEVNVALKSEQDKKVMSYFLNFVKLGGKIIVKIPTFEDIIKEINDGRPAGAFMTTNFLNNSKPSFNFHFNLLTGYDSKYIYVNDPWFDKTGGARKHLIADFIYGIHSSAHGDLDNASLLLVTKS